MPLQASNKYVLMWRILEKLAYFLSIYIQWKEGKNLQNNMQNVGLIILVLL